MTIQKARLKSMPGSEQPSCRSSGIRLFVRKGLVQLSVRNLRFGNSLPRNPFRRRTKTGAGLKDENTEVDDSPKVVHGCPAPFWNQAVVVDSFAAKSGGLRTQIVCINQVGR